MKKQVIIFVCLFAFMLSFSGCQDSDLPAQMTVAPTDTTETKGDIKEPTNYPIRLGWPHQTSLNPLQATKLSELAVYDLIYEGLFRVEANDSLMSCLAENITFMDDGRTVVVVLAENRFYHDNSPVKADDIVAIINWLTDPECTSYWRWGLGGIVEAVAVSERIIQLSLDDPDPWLAYKLIFPVIPADYLEAEPFTVIPGTGLYRIFSFDQTEGLILRQTARPGSAPLIVSSYNDQLSLMRAFVRDELDLLLLDTDYFDSFVEQNSLRFERFNSAEVFFLALNEDNAELNLFLRQTLSDFSKTDSDLKAWAQTSANGLSPISIFNAASSNRGLKADSEWIMEDWPLNLIVPQGDRLRQRLASHIVDWLDKEGLPAVVDSLDQESFQRAIELSTYDLALLSGKQPAFPAPGFLLADRVPDWALSLSLIRWEPVDYQEQYWLNRTIHLNPLPDKRFSEVKHANIDWCEAIERSLELSPFSILALPSQGVFYGDRVVGHLQSSRYHPYQSIEELWLWSGSSSSSS